MKGKRCRCGFSTLGSKPRCPRCGKIASDAEWDDCGIVLSSAKLKIVPNGFDTPMVLVMVQVDGDGPKVACWSDEDIPLGERVTLREMAERAYACEKEDRTPTNIRERSQRTLRVRTGGPGTRSSP